jgi:hypothetical protein
MNRSANEALDGNGNEIAKSNNMSRTEETKLQ